MQASGRAPETAWRVLRAVITSPKPAARPLDSPLCQPPGPTGDGAHETVITSPEFRRRPGLELKWQPPPPPCPRAGLWPPTGPDGTTQRTSSPLGTWSQAGSLTRGTGGKSLCIKENLGGRAPSSTSKATRARPRDAEGLLSARPWPVACAKRPLTASSGNKAPHGGRCEFKKRGRGFAWGRPAAVWPAR